MPDRNTPARNRLEPSQLKERIIHLEKTITTLENQLFVSQSQVNALKNSTSFRITAPLRWLGKRLKPRYYLNRMITFLINTSFVYKILHKAVHQYPWAMTIAINIRHYTNTDTRDVHVSIVKKTDSVASDTELSDTYYYPNAYSYRTFQKLIDRQDIPIDCSLVESIRCNNPIHHAMTIEQDLLLNSIHYALLRCLPNKDEISRYKQLLNQHNQHHVIIQTIKNTQRFKNNGLLENQ